MRTHRPRRRRLASSTWHRATAAVLLGLLCGTMAASSCCASKTPMSAWPEPGTRWTRSWPPCIGWGLTTTRARSTNCNALTATVRWWTACWPKVRPTVAGARPMSSTPLKAAQEARGEKRRYDGTWRPEPGKVLPPVPAGVTPVIRVQEPPGRRRSVGRPRQRLDQHRQPRDR